MFFDIWRFESFFEIKTFFHLSCKYLMFPKAYKGLSYTTFYDEINNIVR